MIALAGWLPLPLPLLGSIRDSAPVVIEPDETEFDCDVDLLADDTDFDLDFDHGLG